MLEAGKVSKNFSLLVCGLVVSLNLFAAEQSGTQNWWRRLAPSRRTVAAASVAVLTVVSYAAAEEVAQQLECLCTGEASADRTRMACMGPTQCCWAILQGAIHVEGADVNGCVNLSPQEYDAWVENWRPEHDE